MSLNAETKSMEILKINVRTQADSRRWVCTTRREMLSEWKLRRECRQSEGRTFDQLDVRSGAEASRHQESLAILSSASTRDGLGSPAQLNVFGEALKEAGLLWHWVGTAEGAAAC